MTHSVVGGQQHRATSYGFISANKPCSSNSDGRGL